MTGHSIRTRVLLALMVMTMVTLGLATLLSAVMDLKMLRDHMVRDLRVLAEVVGENCVSALVFDDPETARRQLATLAREYQIHRALLYDADGREVARWQRYPQRPPAADTPPDAPPDQQPPRLLDTRVRVEHGMRFDDRPVGRILIEARLDELGRQLAEYLSLGGVLAFLTLALALALALRLQRGLSGPILDLAEQSRAISGAGNFAARIRDPGAGPELATLVTGFNTILAAVETRESELARRAEALDRANRHLRRLATRMTLVEERERARLASELHDSPMQKLALAQLQVDSGCRTRDEESDQLLATGLALLREGIGELRSLQFDLSPPILHQRGLPAALEWLAADTRKRWGIPIDCLISPETPPLTQDLEVILFRAARELVYNLVKHARATQGQIRLGTDAAGGLELSVEDNGIGLGDDPVAGHDPGDDSAPGGPEVGFGLCSLRERLTLLGGQICIEPRNPGTRISVRLPAGRLTHPGAGPALSAGEPPGPVRISGPRTPAAMPAPDARGNQR